MRGALAADDLVLLVALVVALAGALELLGRERRRRRRAEAQAVRDGELSRRYAAWQAATRDGVLVLSATGRLLEVSPRAGEILGLDPAAALGRHVGDLRLVLQTESGAELDPAAVLSRRPPYGPVSAAGLLLAPGPVPAPAPELVRVAGPGRSEPSGPLVQVTTRLLPGGEPGREDLLTVVTDVTEAHRAEAALRLRESQFRVAMASSPLGVALVGPDWRLTEVNQAFADLVGTEPDTLRGVDLADLSVPEDRAAERDQAALLLSGRRGQVSVEQRLLRSDGRAVWVVLDAAGVDGPDEDLHHVVVQVREGTDTRLRAEMLAHRAMHDPLTGLANRTLLQEVLQAALEQPGVEDRTAVLLVDLDGFKAVNDRWGHAAGDAVLVHVAGVLRVAVAGRGTVARLGGDEFVVVVQRSAGAQTVFEIAGSIHSALGEPVRVAGHRVVVGASIGIALATPDLARAGSPALLAAADAALYRAKSAGRDRTEVYDTGTDGPGGDRSLLDEVPDALAQGQLVVYYQPIVDLADGRVRGHEALVRWQHPQRGLLLPGVVLPLVEEAGLSVELGTYVGGEAVAWLARSPHPDRWVSVNVSADQLGDGQFAARLLTDVARHRLQPGRVVVELTESSLVAAGTRIRHELTQLADAGVPILLDDFGTGVSPLSYLRDLPVGGVKLDMSFTSGIPDDPTAARVTRALGALAREMTMVTIAEGIETAEQAAFVHRSGWRYGQGWLFGEPQPDGGGREHLR